MQTREQVDQELALWGKMVAKSYFLDVHKRADFRLNVELPAVMNLGSKIANIWMVNISPKGFAFRCEPRLRKSILEEGINQFEFNLVLQNINHPAFSVDFKVCNVVQEITGAVRFCCEILEESTSYNQFFEEIYAQKQSAPQAMTSVHAEGFEHFMTG
ncbi:hypothetical protein THMIRHAS_03410 [Thiosulfatimonas sediminis]|uniref:PilZ domain-containing protein n=1 Tax=Thiosulfatimonas sediminis TaxID=2675054 RepID=A0A6F8PSH2_9GAMM|nr:hypothetical protein [Thiosulfatimonas sediminis]BBP44968.1 hypothetical protein THMIRHAS_03410 [Thiosulfatimonas sediminis]